MNSLELKVSRILNSIGFEVKSFKQKQLADTANTIYAQVPFKNMRLDFALISAKIAIEINGNYWHGLGMQTQSLTSMQLQKRISDARKHVLLNQSGWQLISISESRLSRQPYELIKKLILNSIFI